MLRFNIKTKRSFNYFLDIFFVFNWKWKWNSTLTSRPNKMISLPSKIRFSNVFLTVCVVSSLCPNCKCFSWIFNRTIEKKTKNELQCLMSREPRQHAIIIELGRVHHFHVHFWTNGKLMVGLVWLYYKIMILLSCIFLN